MPSVIEINTIDDLARYRTNWNVLLSQTPGATFFQSFDWLETYWKHFGNGKKLRVLVIQDDDEISGFVPFIVQAEKTRVGRLQVLTFPLDNWGSFYGPIAIDPAVALNAAMNHIRSRPRDFDMIELRWLGSPGLDWRELRNAVISAGFQAYPNLWNKTAVADFSTGWDDYLAGKKGIWLRRLHQTEEKLRRQGKIQFLRCRPKGAQYGDENPRWDLYDACVDIARDSWQAAATDGNTLSTGTVRAFLRDAHARASAAGSADMCLLMFDDRPAAFIYGYYYRGRVYGLRRGFNAQISHSGLGTVLLWQTLKDSASRGDLLYDMGVGSPQSKRHFQNGSMPIYRLSHFSASVPRSQVLRLVRWFRGRNLLKI